MTGMAGFTMTQATSTQPICQRSLRSFDCQAVMMTLTGLLVCTSQLMRWTSITIISCLILSMVLLLLTGAWPRHSRSRQLWSLIQNTPRKRTPLLYLVMWNGGSVMPGD